MNELLAAYVPLTLHTYWIAYVLTQPWVLGYAISPFGQAVKYVDLDVAKRTAANR